MLAIRRTILCWESRENGQSIWRIRLFLTLEWICGLKNNENLDFYPFSTMRVRKRLVNLTTYIVDLKNYFVFTPVGPKALSLTKKIILQ